jgi:hypothetical protein
MKNFTFNNKNEGKFYNFNDFNFISSYNDSNDDYSDSNDDYNDRKTIWFYKNGKIHGVIIEYNKLTDMWLTSYYKNDKRLSTFYGSYECHNIYYKSCYVDKDNIFYNIFYNDEGAIFTRPAIFFSNEEDILYNDEGTDKEDIFCNDEGAVEDYC